MVFRNFTCFRRAGGINYADGLCIRGRLNSDFYRAGFKVQHHLGLRIAPVFNGDSVNRYNLIARLKTCFGGNTGRLDHADIGAQLGHAEGKLKP